MMDFLKKIVEQPAFHTKISSDEIRLPEIALGYFLAPFCAMLTNAIFGAYLTRYYADVLGWTKHAFRGASSDRIGDLCGVWKSHDRQVDRQHEDESGKGPSLYAGVDPPAYRRYFAPVFISQ